MIKKRCVDKHICGKSETHPVATLKSGDVFGKKTLLSSDSDVQIAACVASGRSGKVKCVVLMREDFLIIGSMLEYCRRLCCVTDRCIMSLEAFLCHATGGCFIIGSASCLR